jgi:Kef-type K+ transport system membrane component KefB
MMVRALANLLMITALAYGARSFVPAGETITGSGAALAFGFLLIAALQIGYVTDRFRLTNITGYLLCGLLFGPEILRIVSEPMLQDLALVKGTALGLIALLAGCELNLRRLKTALRAITSVAVVTMTASAVALWVFFFWVCSVLPVTAAFSAGERAAVALVCANVLTAFSPAVVIGVISETRAAGVLTDLSVSVVVIADLAIVITFAISTALARNVFPAAQATGGVGVLIEHVFGSIVAGLLVGGALAIYTRRVRARAGLMVFALLFIVAEAGRALHLDPLLVGLTAGLLIENASSVAGEEIVRAASPVTLPVFAIFFAVVGAEIQLRAFLHVAPWAFAAAAVRAAAIFGGGRLGAMFGRVPRETARLVPLGLLPQAGVAIALSVLVLNDFPPWGRVLGTVLLGCIVVNQLVGPVLFRLALSRAGEIAQAPEHASNVHAAPHAPRAAQEGSL